MRDNGTNDYVVFRTTRAGRSDDEIKARRAFPEEAGKAASQEEPTGGVLIQEIKYGKPFLKKSPYAGIKIQREFNWM